MDDCHTGQDDPLIPQNDKISAISAVSADDARAGNCTAELADRLPLPRTNPLVVIGHVPLFFFLVHLPGTRTDTAICLRSIRGGAFPASTLAIARWLRPLYPVDFGYDLVTVYIVWLLVVALVYPLCLGSVA